MFACACVIGSYTFSCKFIPYVNMYCDLIKFNTKTKTPILEYPEKTSLKTKTK